MEDPWQSWVQSQSEDAFRSVVTLYLPLVLATARRRTRGNAALAQDIAQLVFIDLARNARALPKGVVLSGWLYRHTSFTASKVLRSEHRRSAREMKAAEQFGSDPESPDYSKLDEILARLPAKDRDALLLRFAEGRELQDVAGVLGISPAAAQKRIERALARVRERLPRTLISRAPGAAGLTALFIPAQTKTAAAAMEPAVQQMALLAGKTGGVSPLILFWRNLGTMQSVAMGVAVAVIAWAVPVSVQVREWWNRKSEGTGLTARKGLAAAVTPRARVSAGEAGKQMAEVFLTYGFSQDSAFKALELLKQVPGSERLEAVQALLEALPRGSAQSASVTLVLKNFAQDAAWHPKKYPEDILTALELMPRDTTPEFDAIVENHPDVDATVRLYEEIQRRNKTEPRRRLPAFTRAVARALAGRSIPEALAFCRGCVLSGDAGEALEGLMGAADAPAQRKILWEALAAESDRRFQTALLAKLTNAASMAEVGAFVDGLPAGGFHNAAATLLARKQLAAQERDSQPMEVNAVVDAWLARVPAEERMEQLGPLCDNLPYSYDRAEAFYRRLATVFSGADLDQLLGRWVTTFASVSSPPQIAMEALERIADPDVRFSSACEMVTRWAQLSGGENAREQAAEWMHRTFTAEQREAYELLNSKL